MKKLICGCLVLMLCASMSGCTSKSDTPTNTSAYTEGTYTAAAKGNNGDVSVEVVFTSDAIQSVTITEQQETAGIADGALEKIPAGIVENQSLNIDTIAGATNTSNAILSAVEDCVKQAGGDVEALKNKTTEVVKGEQEEIGCDVVVVGGGAAGTAACLAAVEAGKMLF